MHFFIRDFEDHVPFAMSLPLLEPAGIDIPGLCVNHSALTIWLIGFPFTSVSVAVRIGHGALARFFARDKVSCVGVASEGDKGALTVSTTHLDRTRAIVTPKVEICDVLLEVGRVIVAVQVMEVFHGIRAFTFCFKSSNPIIYSSVSCMTDKDECFHLLCARWMALCNDDIAIRAIKDTLEGRIRFDLIFGPNMEPLFMPEVPRFM